MGDMNATVSLVEHSAEDKHTEHIRENLLCLRRSLKLSQGDFINQYLSDPEGKAMISVPKLSNLERQGGKNLEQIAQCAAQKLSFDASIFKMHPDDFAKNIELFLKNNRAMGAKSPMELHALATRTSFVEKLVHIISEYLTDSILSGELRPGDKLPSDRTLSGMFQVGRTSIREALKVLSVLGLIDIRPGQGTFICRESSSFFTLPLSWSFFMGEHNINYIIDVRNILEAESAKQAATMALEPNLAKLSQVFGQMREAYHTKNLQSFLDLDLDFHLAIAECSQNPIIYNLLLTSRKLVRYISKSGMVSLEHLNQIYEEHTRIYQAIKDRDADAAEQQMRRHLEESKLRYQIKR